MLLWSVHLEGGPRRVNHAAVAVGHKVYSFGGYCSGEDYETLRQIDVHIFNTGWWRIYSYQNGFIQTFNAKLYIKSSVCIKSFANIYRR